VGGPEGPIAGVTDRSNNPNAFFVTMRTNAGAHDHTAFQEIVVC